jgi:hypothetical protein
MARQGRRLKSGPNGGGGGRDLSFSFRLDQKREEFSNTISSKPVSVAHIRTVDEAYILRIVALIDEDQFLPASTECQILKKVKNMHNQKTFNKSPYTRNVLPHSFFGVIPITIAAASVTRNGINLIKVSIIIKINFIRS